MKKILVIFLLAGIVLSCASTGGNVENTEVNGGSVSENTEGSADFSEVTGRDWKLTEVSINGVNTQFSRELLSNAFSESFTLKFDGQNVSGTGAPNLFSAPYKPGENRSISIMVPRSTLMASIFEPENLSEHDYFTYIQKSYTWQLSGGRLELLSRLDDGSEVRLIFEL